MSVVTATQFGAPFTERDLESMPDDGRRYEIIDGVLYVTPSPITVHQICVLELAVLLRHDCPADLRVLVAPFDIRLAEDTVIQPDVLVCRRVDLTAKNLPAPPVLAVEVLSPRTRMTDLNNKKARLERAGCPSYWVVDPAEPSILGWDLVAGAYVEVGHAVGDAVFEARQPYPLTVVPSALIS